MSSQKNKRIKHMLQKNIEFNALRIQRNQIGLGKQLQLDEDYIFQQSLSNITLKCKDKKNQQQNKDQYKVEKIKRSDKSTISKHVDQQAKSLMNQLTYPIHLRNRIQKQSNKENLIENNSNQDDLTDLWNKLQAKNTQQNTIVQENLALIVQTKIQQKNQITQLDSVEPQDSKSIVKQKSQSSSQFQLTEQQMKIWMQNCQQDYKKKQDSNKNKNQRHSNRSNCIYYPYQGSQDKIQQNGQKLQDQEQWNVIAGYLQVQHKGNQTQNKKYKDEGLVSLTNLTQQNNQQRQCFFIIDTPFKQIKKQITNEVTQSQRQIDKKYHNISKFGPWIYSYKHYEIYKKFKLKLIQQVNLDLQKDNKQIKYQQKTKLTYNQSRPLRKINWQIQQQKKPQIKSLRSKRNCKMNVIQFGKDFYIFDHAKFATSSVREGTHLYMGVRAFGDFSSLQFRQISQKSLFSDQKRCNQIKQYMYFPANGQCLLQTVYSNKQQNFNESNVKFIDIVLSLTNQKIAVCQRTIIDQQKDKKQRLQIRIYDNFSRSVQHYLGIIQSKISNFSQQWYCDTIIYVPRKKVYNGKDVEKDCQKFKIQLRLSQIGTIVAQLGIFEARSSVTNCILFGQNKSSQFMMGTIQQTSNQISYITRIAGLSPVLAFGTILSRKIFVMSS